MAMSSMGVALSKQDPYPDAYYGFTDGSDYYVETMFYVGLLLLESHSDPGERSRQSALQRHFARARRDGRVRESELG